MHCHFSGVEFGVGIWRDKVRGWVDASMDHKAAIDWFIGLPRFEGDVGEKIEWHGPEVFWDELESNQALWFRQEKDDEELFDTQNDPHELNNLANDTSYHDHLVGFRNELDRWTQEIGDKGDIQEVDLISEFYPDGKAQMTQMPKASINDGIVTLENIDSGLSIGYKFSSEIKPNVGWKHYDGPIKESLNDTLKIVAHKVGYKYGIINIVNGQVSQPVYPNNRHDSNE